jgi:Flp pilus assembly pilin Flp
MSQMCGRFVSFARVVGIRFRRGAAVVSMSRDRGQDLVEYGVAIAVVAVVVLVAMEALGTGIAGVFTRLLTHFAGLG